MHKRHSSNVHFLERAASHSTKGRANGYVEKGLNEPDALELERRVRRRIRTELQGRMRRMFVQSQVLRKRLDLLLSKQKQAGLTPDERREKGEVRKCLFMSLRTIEHISADFHQLLRNSVHATKISKQSS